MCSSTSNMRSVCESQARSNIIIRIHNIKEKKSNRSGNRTDVLKIDK